MKRARLTEEQIIGVPREHEAGAKTADLARRHGFRKTLGSDVVQMEIQIWRDGRFGGKAADAARGKEPRKAARIALLARRWRACAGRP
jgi:putative transposase